MFKRLIAKLRVAAPDAPSEQVLATGLSSATVDRVLHTVGPDQKEAAEQLVPAIIDAVGAQGARGLARGRRDRARAAEATAAAAERTAAGERIRAADLREQARQLDRGSLVQGMLLILCALIGVAAELALNLGTIPFLLDTSPRSVLGVALAAAPTTAVLILDVILERSIEGPYRTRRLTTRGRRVVAWLGMAAFMIAVAALVVINVLLYGEVREEARSVMTGIKETVGQTVLRRAVLALSVLVAIAAAWFCTLGTAELRAWRARRAAHRQSSRAARASERADAAARLAQTAASTTAADAADAEADAADAVRAFRAEAMLRLALRVQAPPPPPEPPAPELSIAEIVEARLRRRVARGARPELAAAAPAPTSGRTN